MAYANTTRAGTAGITDWLNAAVKTVRDAIARRRLYIRTFRELNTLNDRELADLGIHRAMISVIAAEAANGK